MSDIATSDATVTLQSDNTPTSPLQRLLRAAITPRYLIPMILLVVVTAAFTTLKLVRVNEMSGDSAIFLQVTENIASRGAAVSQVFETTQNFIEGTLHNETAQQIAGEPLAPPSTEERNMLRFHGYFVLYPIAALAKVFPADVVLLTLHVLSYTGLLLLVYFMLRSRSVPIALALLFLLLVVSHPAWSQGLLWGQFYPDRLFVLAGFLLMFLVSRKNAPPAAVVATAIACALINERGALMSGVFLLAYSILYWRKVKESRAFYLALAFALLVVGVLITKVLLSNGYYSTFMPTSLAQLSANFHNPDFVQKAVLFLLVNAPLLILACFEWRAALIAALLMLPNLLGYMGGAEKIKWVTHYPSYYLPALIWAAALGLVSLYKGVMASRRPVFAYGAIAAAILALNMVDPASASSISVNLANIKQNFLIEAPQELHAYVSPGGFQLRTLTEDFFRRVPSNSVISTPESAMPFLYKNRTLYFFPIDVDHADYAILNIDGNTAAGKPIYGGVVSYLGPDEQKKIDAAMVERMRKDGYDLAHPRIFPSLSIAIFTRKHRL